MAKSERLLNESLWQVYLTCFIHSTADNVVIPYVLNFITGVETDHYQRKHQNLFVLSLYCVSVQKILKKLINTCFVKHVWPVP